MIIFFTVYTFVALTIWNDCDYDVTANLYGNLKLLITYSGIEVTFSFQLSAKTPFHNLKTSWAAFLKHFLLQDPSFNKKASAPLLQHNKNQMKMINKKLKITAHNCERKHSLNLT